MPIDITIQLPNATVGAKPPEGTQDEVLTTTAYQLRVDRISHTFADDSPFVPLPTNNTSFDQLWNQYISLGFRTEEIQLQGILVDRSTVSASNPRRQTILDLARAQWRFVTGATGGGNATPDNPNSYPLLTIAAGTVPSNAAPGSGISTDTNTVRPIPPATNPVDSPTSTNSYRGLIKEVSFTNQGGRPDIWEWTMRFSVVMNEHDY